MDRSPPITPSRPVKRVRLGGLIRRSQKGSDTKDTADVYTHHPPKVQKVSMAQKYAEYKAQATGIVMITRFRSARVATANQWEVLSADDRNLRFEVFTPKKFKDAEAVSFYGKALTYNGYNTSSLISNGPTLRELCVANSRARFDFKNVSQHTVTVELYVCCMKRDQTYAGTYPEGDLNLALDMYAGNSSSSSYNTLYMDPLSVKSWTDMWEVKKIKIIMEPGETASHTLQGPSRYVMDPKRHVELGTTESAANPLWLGPEMVGNGYYCFIRMLNQITFLATDDAGTAANSFMGGRKIYPGHPINPVPATDKSLQGGVVIKLQEYYSIKCPLGVDDVDQRNVLVDFVPVTGTPIDVQIDSDQPLTTTTVPL